MPARLVADRYELRELLGEGGMGVVYRAIDTRTGGLVAIKTMRDISDPRTLEMFKKEWRVLARLSHPNIVDIRDVDEMDEDGVRKPCYVMPLLPGVTLAQLIKEASPRLTIAGVVKIVSQVCNGLEAAHKHDLIHRDLKPSNIFVMEDDTAKIIDFGLVHAADGNSITGYKGTWQYMAPEQTEGKPPTVQSDIFAVGVVAYEALTGRKPFARKTVEATVEAVRTYIPPTLSEINPKVSQLLSKVIHKAMAKDPKHRYFSAKEFAETLQKAYRNEPIERFEPARILPRIERARAAFTRGDCAFASEILGELEAEGNVDPEITLLRAQIEEAVKQKRISQLFEGAQTRLEQDEIPLALDKLVEILTLDPENAEALAMRKRIEDQRNKQQISDWMKLARQHLELHDFSEARQALKEVLSIRYDDSEALHLLSDIDVQEKEAAKARSEKEQLYGSALKAYQGGEISTALSKLEKILELSRRTPGATVPERDAVYQSFYNRVRSERDSIDKAYEDGKKFLNDKDFRKALEICDQMLASYPNSAQFHALKLKVEQAERQELSSYIAEVSRSVDAEPDLDRRMNILEEACKRYPNEAQFQQSLRLVREQRDLAHSILAKARQYEEQAQFADAVAQWKILRNIHPQYPGIDFEIVQLEKSREQQSAEEKKTRFTEQIDRAVENGAFSKAVRIAEEALADFPQDSELVVLERLARQGLERVSEAERHFEEARIARSKGQYEAATELLRTALKLDDRNAGIRNALVSILVERSQALLDKDWHAAEPMAQSAAELDATHPAVKRLLTLIAEAKRRDGIAQCIADARQKKLSGDVQGALDRLGNGLSQFPGEKRILDFQTSLQNSLESQRQPRAEQALEPSILAVPDKKQSDKNESGRATRSEAPPQEPETALYSRTEFDALAESLVTSPEVAARPPGTKPGRAIPDSKLAKSPDSPPLLVKVRSRAKASALASAQRLRPLFKQLTAADLLRPERLRIWVPVLAGIVLLIAIGIWASHTQKPKTPANNIQPRVQAITVPVTLSPADSTLTIDGVVRAERNLTLDSSKTYKLHVSRLGYKPLDQSGITPDPNGWKFSLDPERLLIQVLTSERSGKILLDDQEIASLQGGSVTREIPADDNHHVLLARNQTGDLFRIEFQASPGTKPQVEPLTTEELLVGTSLGEQADVLSGSQPSSFNLPGQQAQDIAKEGTHVDLKGADADQVVLSISDRKLHRNFEFALPHGNAPVLAVSVNANPNLGAVTITTTTPNAQLFFDGRERQTRKPGSWRISAQAGSHEIRLVAPGYADETRTVQVDKGQNSEQSIELKPAQATLAILGGVPNAGVRIDGTSVGTLDSNGNLRVNVEPAPHTIDVEKDGFESASLRKAFTAGQTLEIPGRDILLKPFATLTFDIAPPNATVQYRRVDETDWHAGSTSGSVKVRAGKYEVKATAEGYPPESQILFIGSGASSIAAIELKRPVIVPAVRQTPDFLMRPNELTTFGDWYMGTNNAFLELRPSRTFTFAFLRPDRLPKRKKKLEWRVSLYPDIEVDFELENQQITYVVKRNGKTAKSPKQSFPLIDNFYAVKLILEPHRIVVKSKGGMLMDEFADGERDWSHASVAIRGDQAFTVDK